jgi:tRNA-dihydrouridine synthase
MIFQDSHSNSPLRKGDVRFVVVKLFIDLLVAEGREKTAVSLIERVGAERAFVANNSFSSYAAMLRCLLFFKNIGVSLSQVAENPFILKTLIDCSMEGSSTSRRYRTDDLEALKDEIHDVLKKNRDSDDLLDMHFIHLVLVHHQDSSTVVSKLCARMLVIK